MTAENFLATPPPAPPGLVVIEIAVDRITRLNLR
jgi:hypothetical protein